MQGLSTSLRLRQKYYWEGRKEKEEDNNMKAIALFQLYSEQLDPLDKHIPFQWIAQLYGSLGDPLNEAKYYEMYAHGCSPNRAALFLKKSGDIHLAQGDRRKAITLFKQAIEHDKGIGLKKKIVELEKSIQGYE